MARRAILALDEGTTSTRAIVFDASGAALGSASQEITQLYPAASWVEHDPDEIFAATVAVGRAALDLADVDVSEIAGVGITNQRETAVVWERGTGQPIHNAVVWQSRASVGVCDDLKRDGLEPLFRDRTGLVVDAYFSGTKIRWLLDRVDGAQERAERGELLFGTIDSWLTWKLTGGRVHATDVSNASRTLLLNITTGDWDDDLLAALRVPRALLPRVGASSGVYGETDATIFGRPIPIAGIAGDQHAALFGQVCFQPGDAKNTYGTGCFLLTNTGATAHRSDAGLLTTVAWDIGQGTTYALEGSVFVAGAAVQWLRDGLRIIDDAAETERLAEAIPDNGGVYLVPAFVGLGAPNWDPHARGLLIGLTRGVGREHLARATLESIAYQSRDIAEAMAQAGGAIRVLKVDGGGTANGFLMQFQADMLGVPITVAAVQETTALGAAYLAGLATGMWSGTAQLATQWRSSREYEPRMGVDQRETLYAAWLRAVQRSKGWETAGGQSASTAGTGGPRVE